VVVMKVRSCSAISAVSQEGTTLAVASVAVAKRARKEIFMMLVDKGQRLPLEWKLG
jgi:hypothetical protein